MTSLFLLMLMLLPDKFLTFLLFFYFCMTKNPVYEADEDSYLLIDSLSSELSLIKSSGVKLSSLSLLDMGTGSGVIGEFALKKKISVTFADINPDSISLITNKFSKKKNSTIIESDLFENIPSQKFDLITFNTPYLPEDEDLFDPALHGGPIGYEVTVRFIDSVVDYLSEKGVLIFLISTLTHPDVVEAALYKQKLDFEIVNRKKLFFEELLVYRVTRRG